LIFYRGDSILLFKIIKIDILLREQNNAWIEAGIAANKVNERGFF
jgi:hypothetical protein